MCLTRPTVASTRKALLSSKECLLPVDVALLYAHFWLTSPWNALPCKECSSIRKKSASICTILCLSALHPWLRCQHFFVHSVLHMIFTMSSRLALLQSCRPSPFECPIGMHTETCFIVEPTPHSSFPLFQQYNSPAGRTIDGYICVYVPHDVGWCCTRKFSSKCARSTSWSPSVLLLALIKPYVSLPFCRRA